MARPPDRTYLFANIAVVLLLWIAAGAAIWRYVPLAWPLRVLTIAVAATGLLFFEYRVLMKPVCRAIDAVWPGGD